ncbi:unnamed protein product, partial [Symbiodinium sp. CCMP2456]
VERTVPFAVDEPVFTVPEPGANVAQAQAGAFVDIQCLVYAPDYIPDMLLVSLAIPCSVEHASAAFEDVRDASQAQCFDLVFPAAPQPARHCAVYVAAPAWCVDRVVVLFNLLALDRSIFSAAVPLRLNKASLLLVAGRTAPAEYDVFVHGLVQPLEPDLWIELRHGLTVAVVPAGQGPPHGWILSEMLQESGGWNHREEILGPGGGRRRSVRTDIFEALDYQPWRATLKPSTPRVGDHMACGFISSGVLVAAEALSCVPWPPARVREHRRVLILDCRPVLQAFRWRLVDQDFVSLQVLADQFLHTCPDSHLVAFKGADIIETPEGLGIMVSQGLIIRVEFQPEDTTTESASAVLATFSESDGMSLPGADPLESPGQGAAVSLAGENDRSRSPRLSDDAPHDVEQPSMLPTGTGLPTDRGESDASPLADCPVQVHTAFAILMPGFVSESVEVTLSVPTTVTAALACVQAHRDVRRAYDFPRLVPTIVQPDPCWGLLLACPQWTHGAVSVCIDMYAYRHRVFHVVGPACVNRDILLDLAGLSPEAHVDVFCDMQGPLARSGTVDLRDGSTITITEQGGAAPWSAPLASMLCTHLPWHVGPAFNFLDDVDHYWLACADGAHAFALLPNRSSFYKADIAVKLRCNPRALSLTPARPLPVDAAIFGFPCHSVVAAIDRSALAFNDSPSVGLLDARCLLRGWIPLVSLDGWVDQRSLLAGVCPCLAAPWVALIWGYEDGRRWIYVEDGEVLVAYCRPRLESDDGHTTATASGQLDGQPAPLVRRQAPSGHGSPLADQRSGRVLQATVGLTLLGAGDACDIWTCAAAESPNALGVVEVMWRIAQHWSAVVDSKRCLTPILLLIAFGLIGYGGAVLSQYALPGSGHACDPRSSRPIGTLTNKAEAARRDRRHVILTSPLLLALVVSAIAMDSTLVFCTGAVFFGLVPMHSCGFHLFCAASVFATHGQAAPTAPIPLQQTCAERVVPVLSRASAYGKFQQQVPRARRPLPTPCRGPIVRPLWDQYSTDPLTGEMVTLLQQSCRQMQGYPLYEAATLLETLMQHRRQPMPPAGHPGMPGPVRLSLQSMLPDSQSTTPARPAVQQVQRHAFFFPALPEHASADSYLCIGSTELGFTVGQLNNFLSAPADLNSWADVEELGAPISKFSGCAQQAAMASLSNEVGRDDVVLYTDGSFFPPSSTSHARAGWAVICVDMTTQEVSLSFGQIPQFLCAESERPTPYLAECAGLLAAGVLRTNLFYRRRVHFRSDCVSALDAAAGRCTFQLEGLPRVMGAAHAFLQLAIGQEDVYTYTPGHAGIWGNEIADVVSKFAARRHRVSCGVVASRSSISFWLDPVHPRMERAAIVVARLRGNSALPPVNDMGLHRPQPPPGADGQPRCATLNLKCASFNVLSLGPGAEEGLAYQPARAALLADQLAKGGIHVAMLQETRAAEGMSVCGPFLRYASGSVRGQFGTEIWLRAGHPLVTKTAGPDGTVSVETFRKEAIAVLMVDTRRVLLRFSGRDISILFVAFHAPHRATEACLVDSWWAETKRLIRQHRRDSLVVLGGDCNASVGSVVSSHIGRPLAAESEDIPGEHLHVLLADSDLWLPATFDSCHTGETHTYTHKNGKHTCRPDFVAIPELWARGRVTSWCDPSIHAAHSTPDHVAVCVGVTLHMREGVRSGSLCRRANPVNVVADPDCQTRIATLLKEAPCIPWGVSVHAHAAILADHVQSGLANISTKHVRRPHHAYITDETWGLQRQVARMRRELHRLTGRIAHHTLAASFAAWRLRISFVHAADTGRQWFTRADNVRTHLQQQLKAGCAALRKACRKDRDAHISALAQTIATAPTKDAYAALHRVLAHRRKKPFSLDPLPMIHQGDGTACADAHELQTRWREHFANLELQTRWREHFANLEAGRPTSFETLADSIPDYGGGEGVHPPCITDVPSFPLFRRVLAATKSGRAPGMDALPPELNRLFPNESAHLLFPLLLKIAWQCQEPMGFKGGQAVTLYKGKGCRATCSSFRSILLMCTWAKSMHQALRPALRSVFDRSALPMQIGGRIGCSVTFGSYALRSTIRVLSGQGRACYVLFADISAAFYTALLQLIASRPGLDDQSGFDRALEGLQLPAEALQEVRNHLCDFSALSTANASTWLEHLALNVGTQNWFLLVGDDKPVQTGRGTRPGSSWADVLFAILIPRILGRRDEILQSLGSLARVPSFRWDGGKCLQPVPADAPVLEARDVIWADDIAVPKFCAHAAELPVAVRREATALAEAFFEFGFRLSYGDHKTAALISACGHGSRKTRRDLFGQGGPKGGIPLLFENLSAARLPLPLRYKHLGVQQMPLGGMLEELRFRTSQARSAFAEARRKVFRSRAIPLRRKAMILASTVLSKLLLGAGSWPPLNKREERLFDGTLWSLYRSVLGIKFAEDQHITASTCFALLQMPDPGVTLRCSRLSYLAQMLRAAPDPLWAIVRADLPYMELLWQDLSWLYAWCHCTMDWPHPRADWGSWATGIVRFPGRFKGFCKRARLLTVYQHTVRAALDGLHRALCIISNIRPDAPADSAGTEHTELCLPCRRSSPWSHGCAKLFASRHRLRRHLVTSQHCVANWGAWRQVSHGMEETDFSPTLLASLEELDGCTEEEVWEVVEGVIEPLAVLRATVLCWRNAHQASEWHAMVAENVLLLLDPAVLADSKQATKPRPPKRWDVPPEWTLPGAASLASHGERVTRTVTAPPPAVLPPYGPRSMPIRLAFAYALWLEDVTRILAEANAFVLPSFARASSGLGPSIVADVTVNAKPFDLSLNTGRTVYAAAGPAQQDRSTPDDLPTESPPPLSRRSPVPSRFHYLSWNAGGFSSSRYQQLGLWLQQRAQHLSLVAIQETHWSSDWTFRTHGWNAFHSPSTDRVSGILILLNMRFFRPDRIQFCELIQGRLVHVRLEGEPSMDVLIVYQFLYASSTAHPGQEGLDRSLERRANLWAKLHHKLAGLPARNGLLLTGDFNCDLHSDGQYVGSGLRTRLSRPQPDQDSFQNLLHTFSLQAPNTWRGA